jgi:Mrp family chromosome partitioning ATPase/capsular polysaccharide biosynthesis protein
MLYKSPEPSASAYGAGSNAAAAEGFDLRWMVDAVFRRRRLVIILPLALMALAALFVFVRPPSYTAATQLQLTNLRLALGREDAFFAETHPDPTFLETQLQVIRSDRVALSALGNLEILGAEATAEQKAKALEDFRRRFQVDRAGLSNVVHIAYTASDPETAARVANELARAYIAELNASRLDAARAGSSWLRDRLREVGPKARVIAEALPPPNKSNIRGILIIAIAGMLGGVLAVVVAIASKLFDRRITTPEEAASAIGAECLGLVPHMPRRKEALMAKAVPTDFETVGDDAIAMLPEPEYAAGRSFAAESSRLAYVFDNPQSNAWLTLRNVKAACDDCFGGKGLRHLGITSTFAGEGRSTVACNLALALAMENKRVLLVDGDIYSPTLTHEFASEDQPGLIDYIHAEAEPLASYVLNEQRTGLKFLPLGIGDQGASSIWTDGLRRLFDEAGMDYDYVILDMPSLDMLGDVRAAVRSIDGFLFVVKWRQVSAESIQVGISGAGALHDRLLGTVLNDVNTGEARWSLSPQTIFSQRRNRIAASQPAAGAPRSVRRFFPKKG